MKRLLKMKLSTLHVLENLNIQWEYFVDDIWYFAHTLR